jgi:hypothetical protein
MSDWNDATVQIALYLTCTQSLFVDRQSLLDLFELPTHIERIDFEKWQNHSNNNIPMTVYLWRSFFGSSKFIWPIWAGKLQFHRVKRSFGNCATIWIALYLTCTQIFICRSSKFAWPVWAYELPTHIVRNVFGKWRNHSNNNVPMTVYLDRQSLNDLFNRVNFHLI